MLVLKRQLKERVIITVPPSDRETQVEVQLVDSTSDWAKLGFEGPPRAVIDREEVTARKALDRKLAAGGTREAPKGPGRGCAIEPAPVSLGGVPGAR